jgi:hypothetical protein
VLLVDDTHQLLYVGGMHTFACGDTTCAVSDDDTVTTNRIGVSDLRTHTWAGLADDDGVGLNSTVPQSLDKRAPDHKPRSRFI